MMTYSNTLKVQGEKVFFVAILGVILAQLLLNIHLSKEYSQEKYEKQTIPERLYKIEPKLFETFSFGNLSAAVDWIWMVSVMESSNEHVQPGKHPQLFYDLDLITDLDPNFREVYTAGANLLSVVRNDGPGARDLLLKGTHFIQKELPLYSKTFKERFWHDSWALSTLLAYVYLFELNDMPRAAEAFRQAATFEDAPPYILRLEKRLQVPGGEYEVGLKLLNFMISASKDERIRKELEKKRYNLFIGQFLFDINYGFRDYLKNQPSYRTIKTLSPNQLEAYWKSFKRVNQIPEQDPWGGKLYMTEIGKIKSTTSHDSVFGLE